MDDPRLLEFIRGGGSGGSGGYQLRNMAVLRCVSLICGTVGMLPINLIEAGPEKRIAKEHPAHRLLKIKPNGWQTPLEFKRQMMLSQLRHGDAIRGEAPVEKGVTRKSVVAAAKRDNPPGTFTAGVKVVATRREDSRSTPAYTWRFSELGTSKEPARPWIRPTWDSNEDEIAGAVRERLASAIDEALSRR